MNTRRAALVALAVAGGLGVLLPLPAAAREDKVMIVQVVLKEWTLKPNVTTVPAGTVTFITRNAGGIPHELVVLRPTRHHRALATKGGTVVEQGLLGKVQDILPRQTKKLTLTLAPGDYALLCNVQGHYSAGQHAGLRVR